MIQAKTTANTALVIQSTQLLPARIDAAMATGLQRGLLHAAAVAQREYLQGPRPQRLGVRTRRLRDSVTTQVEVKKAEATGTITGMMGSNMRYAGYHEFGFHGTVSVKSFTRINRFFSAKTGKPLELRRRITDNQGHFVAFRDTNAAALQRAKNKKGIGINQVQVRGHTRRVDYLGRPFIRPAMEKSLPIIEREVNKEVAAAQGTEGLK